MPLPIAASLSLHRHTSPISCSAFKDAHMIHTSRVSPASAPVRVTGSSLRSTAPLRSFSAGVRPRSCEGRRPATVSPPRPASH